MLISVFYDTGTFNADISGWQVSSTCDFTNMFENAEAFCPAAGFGCAGGWANTAITQAEILSGYRTNCAGTVDFTCSDNKLRSLSIRDAIQKMYSTSTATAIKDTIVSTYGVIANWDVSHVTNMDNLFNMIPDILNLRANFNPDLSTWVTSNVVTMRHLFSPLGHPLSSFNSVISNWNVANVVDMESSKLLIMLLIIN